MKILALEFSSGQRSVAVVSADACESGSRIETCETVETDTRGTSALEMVDEVLRRSALEREQIGCLAVGLGPGSYTGIRAAISIAQGWQLAAGVKLLGISSVDGLASQAQGEGILGRVNIVIDAQRGEFYLATYQISSEKCRLMAPLQIVSRDDVRKCGQAGEILVGHDVTRCFPNAKQCFPRAEMLGKLALDRTDFQPGEKLEPIYLREISFVKAPPPRVL